MTLVPYYGAVKLATLVLGVGAVTVILMDPTVKVAIISAIPPTVSAFVWGWVNHVKIATVEVNTNSKLTELLKQRNEAASRADRAEGIKEGSDAERIKPVP